MIILFECPNPFSTYSVDTAFDSKTCPEMLMRYDYNDAKKPAVTKG